jgi:oligoribonuclease NrnB/cAMP/cGMP phosphodiesterase (DHH superfamily)
MQKITLIDNVNGKSIKDIDPSKLDYDEKLAKLVKASKEIYCISRSSNMDGMGSPAFLIRDYGLKAKNILFIQQKEFKFLLSYIKNLKPRGSVFIIADLTINDDQIKYVKEILSILKKGKNIIIWLDHHPWSTKQINTIKEIKFGISGENDLYCATELVYVLLCKRNVDNKILAKMIHINDFALNSKEFGKINEKIAGAINHILHYEDSLQRNLRAISFALAKKDFKNKIIENSYKHYLNDSKLSIKLLVKNMNIVATSPYKICLGFSKRLHTNFACEIMEKKTDSDIQVFINTETGKCGMRSRKGVDCSILAASLNGGGHPQASGFVISQLEFKNLNKGKQKYIALMTKLAKEDYKN